MQQLQLLSISSEEFRETISEELKKALGALMELLPKESGRSDLMTRQEAADFLSVDLSTLYNWQKQGKIVAHGLSGRVYFKRSEIEKALIPLNERKTHQILSKPYSNCISNFKNS